MKTRILFSVLMISGLSVFAQDDNNLVNNGGFEQVTGKLKKGKSIALAKGWTSPTPDAADLYSRTLKEGEAAAPVNLKGNEAPAEGNNYAGVTMFSYGDKSARTYIMTELIGPLKAGVKYCVRFDVSLADLSKYAVNNIGAHVSKKPFSFEDKGKTILAETHVKNSKNKVFNATYGWETVCAVFTANGGEKYLTIGNFSPTKETKNEKVEKPKGNAQQIPVAYYYVDNVQVFQLDSIEQCMCEKKDKIEAATVIVDEGYASNKDYKLEEKIAHEKVYFTNLSVELNPLALAAINEIVSLLQNNPDLVIEIHAHVDPSEAALATKNDQAKDLAKRRGEAVIKQIEKAGIASNRLMLVVDEDKSPVATGDSESDKAKNRRVEFKMR